MEERTYFDSLVSELSNSERLELLNKMKGSSDPEIQNIEIVEENNVGEEEKDLNVRISKESFFVKLWLKIKSFLHSCSISFTYNNYLISNIEKKVAVSSSAYYDLRRKVLLPAFYESLQELRQAANFFKSSVSVYEGDPGAFYVFFGSLAVPDLSEQIEKASNPFQFGFDKPDTAEQKQQLVRKMEEILQSIPNDKRNLMYNSIKSLEWLKAFTQLPFERFISRFESEGKTLYCKIDSCEAEITAIANILCKGKNIPTEILEALYLFSNQSNIRDLNRQNSDDDSGGSYDPLDFKETPVQKNCKEFVVQSIEKIALIKKFNSNVPIKQLAKISNKVSTWEPQFNLGCEDWFVVFKAQWKKLLDESWENWLSEKKKFMIQQNLQHYFQRNDFPLLGNRPWAVLFEGIVFKKDYSTGYLYAFCKKIYPDFKNVLNFLMINGQFTNPEKLKDFTEVYYSLNAVEQSINQLNEDLSPKGDLGISFAKIAEESSKSIQSFTKAKSNMKIVKTKAVNIIAQFMESAKNMTTILTAILTPQETLKKEIVANLSHLKNNESDDFKQQLETVKKGLLDAVQAINQLEFVDGR